MYPGISLRYDGTQSQLKGTYSVAPNSDPSIIRWRYKDITETQIDTEGNLVITLPHPKGKGHNKDDAPPQTLIESVPVAWQDRAGSRVSVSARYAINNDGSIGFALGAYDHTLPLLIDPTLSYSTYLGGSGVDDGNSIAVDSGGNAYVAGTTRAANFPTANALQTTLRNFDGFVTKLNAQGTALVYSTYLGGTGQDFAYGIAVDGAGSPYITGITTSRDFPTANAAQPTHGGSWDDAYVTKLNAQGNGLVYSTYLGGIEEDRGHAIAVDSAGQVYITGSTASVNFPLNGPLQSTLGGGKDGFVVN